MPETAICMENLELLCFGRMGVDYVNQCLVRGCGGVYGVGFGSQHPATEGAGGL